ncbi:MAG: hypothetical protein KGZ74_06735 [Chitinophagaceae bacterium]|nr:hypothetical protein [Chitinophagaceae bacterium]
MSIGVFYIKTLDNKQGCFKIGNLCQLTGKEAISIREEIKELLHTDCEKIFLDTKDVKEAELSGINEIIHSHYTLQQTGKQLVLIYRTGSSVEKWVQTTGLDRFVQTAILPTL